MSGVLNVTATVTETASVPVVLTAPPSGLSLSVAYGGTTGVFDPTVNGIDLGPYVDPQGAFVQGCIKTTCPALPAMTVFFRSDADGSRDEIVVELGAIAGTPPAPAAPFGPAMGSYTATVIKNGVTLATDALPGHYWRSRWRWQSAPRPVRTTVAQLVAAGLIPQFDFSICPATKSYAPQSYTPMTMAGLTSYEPETGERGDIGLVTEWQADWLDTQTPATLATMLAQAEAMATFPWHYRDEATGAPYDALANAHASTYTPNAGASPLIANPQVKIDGAFLIPDQAHMVEGSWLPFLLTGDPYHLETMQFQVVFSLLTMPPASRYGTGGGPRAFCWPVRTCGRTAVATPAAVPGWLLPKAWFETVLGNYMAWMDKSIAMVPPAPEASFRVISQTPLGANPACFDFWMSDMLTAVLEDLYRLGRVEVLPRLTWQLGSLLARTNGTSGWPRGVPTMYNCFMTNAGPGTMPTTWAALFANNVLLQPAAMVFDPSDPTGNAKLSLPNGGAMTYISYARGVLAMACRRGDPDAVAPFAFLDPQVRALCAANKASVDRKWCFA